jgi:hypothetical protein
MSELGIDTTPEGAVYVELWTRALSANSALAGKPFVSAPAGALKFNLTALEPDGPSVPVAELVTNLERAQPTRFESAQEARAVVEDVKRRVRAITEVTRSTGQHPTVNLGIAPSLIPTYIGGVEIGGYQLKPYAEIDVQLEYASRLAEEARQARIAEADQAVEEAERRAADLRADASQELRRPQAELIAGAANAAQANADATRAATRADRRPIAESNWRGLPGHAGIQCRMKSDASVAYRARAAGKVSESFATLDQATAWRDAEQAAA